MLISSDDIRNAIRSGNDDDVLEVLYQNTLPKVRSYVQNNRGTKEEAEDIFQDAVLNVYQMVYNNNIESVSNIGGFIFQSCKNAWINKAKRDSRKAPLDDKYEYTQYDDDSLEVIIDEEKQTALNQLFEKIGQTCKELMTMAVYQKLSMEEIAKKMGLTNADAAKSQNYRCKKKMADLIEKQPMLKTLFRS